MDLKDKVIIITGASAGIGEATARLLAKEGARLALVARSPAKLAALEKELPGAHAIVADMSKPADVHAMIAAAQKHFGHIDVLVNNAGQGLYGPLEHINLDDFAAVWQLNVVGPLAAMEAVIPLMRAQGGGTIINISSMVSKNAIPNLAGYTSTKYALNALSLTARAELASDNIAVTLVHPSLTATDFGKNARRAAGTEHMVPRNRPDMPAADSAELVAGKILEAIKNGASGPAEIIWR